MGYIRQNVIRMLKFAGTCDRKVGLTIGFHQEVVKKRATVVIETEIVKITKRIFPDIILDTHLTITMSICNIIANIVGQKDRRYP